MRKMLAGALIVVVGLFMLSASNVSAQPCVSDEDCDDGLYCNGIETCDIGGTNTCQAGTPIDCDDLVACTDDICDEVIDACVNIPNDANCPDDGSFCNGNEYCDAGNDCSSTGDPCLGQAICDEATDQCIDCLVDGDCEDSNECTTDTCDAGLCLNTPVANGTACDDGLFCTETDLCQEGICEGTGNPCPAGTFCNESADICVNDSDEDGDGIPDDQDNCPNHPNGPLLGTCLYGTIGETCTSNQECGTSGFCDMNQEDNYPPGGNGIGDACECEADFDRDGDVDAEDVTKFLEDFGRGQYSNPCP